MSAVGEKPAGPAATAGTSGLQSLAVLHSPDPLLRGRAIDLGRGVSVGRSAGEGVDVVINDRLLSRRHATIQPLAGGGLAELVDHDSRNGSFVDGVRASRAVVHSGSIIRLGVTLFELTDERGDDVEATLDDDSDEREPLVGRSPAFRAAVASLGALAEAVAPLMIIGEAGTGKKRIAQRIHQQSGRTGSFVVARAPGGRLSPARLFGQDGADGASDGFLAMADGGTLLLDEVDLLPPAIQEDLERFLASGDYTPAGATESRRADVRIVACSTAHLEAAVKAGAFLGGLFEKLSQAMVEVPPLRSRKSDIPVLARHFLRIEAPERRFDWSATCLEKLLLHDWPGNVRELHAVMRRLALIDEEVTTLRSAHLPKEIRNRLRQPTEDALRASAITVHTVPSREELARVLSEHKGDVASVAEHYMKDRRMVYRWLLRHDLSASDFRK
jgi:DNA-binding NtrC family response regulator